MPQTAALSRRPADPVQRALRVVVPAAVAVVAMLALQAAISLGYVTASVGLLSFALSGDAGGNFVLGVLDNAFGAGGVSVTVVLLLAVPFFVAWLVFAAVDLCFGHRWWALLRALALAPIPVVCGVLQFGGFLASIAGDGFLPGAPWNGPLTIVLGAVLTAAIATALYGMRGSPDWVPRRRARPADAAAVDPAGASGADGDALGELFPVEPD
ncbi:hypothetical protein [Leifsonia poae]|uniref:hypothetical protein n=1 Tax=Leifsonia poae TaxID=110933 RepID=UPI001CBD450E|nr:hypothetical protein [Leifsonia poae]